ncbi:MAG TPA: histidine phosphatase family protein [Anaerolineales bacterium]|nr:histidine phosphatase family protein [Anaerolineales bacterium]
MKDEIHIIFMRHGRSRADDEGVHEGRYDSPLTEVGRSQAYTRAQEFLSLYFQFDKIISSPLQRAYGTAIIISQLLNTPVETDTDWMEMDNGPLAGLTREAAAERYPRPIFRNPYEPFCGTGESNWEIYCRGARAVEKIIRRGTGNYLVVAHGGILNSAMRTIVGTQPSVNQQGIAFGFGDCGYARLIYRPAEHLWLLLEFKAGLT